MQESALVFHFQEDLSGAVLVNLLSAMFSQQWSRGPCDCFVDRSYLNPEVIRGIEFYQGLSNT